jgi:hypothetical protein
VSATIERNELPAETPASPGIMTLFKLAHGEPLAAEEQLVWDAWQAHEREQEEARSRIGLVDIGEIMERGVEPPDMLVQDWLVKGAHHIFFGPPGSAKTWAALLMAAVEIRSGQRVLWVDLEMGRESVAERLLALGLTPGEVSGYLTYLEYPAFTASEADRDLWAGLVQQLQPALVVWDAQTGALSAADVEENSGTGNAKWQRWYVEPVRRVGGTVIVIDHTGHDDKGRPVASRQKMAAAKVALSFSVKKGEEPSREKAGFVTVECTKNNLSAAIPTVRRFQVGPDAETGRFMFAPAEATILDHLDAPSAQRGAELMRIRNEVSRLVREHSVEGVRLSQRQLEQLMSGRAADIRREAKELAASKLTGVRSEPGPRGSIQYFWVDDQPE